MSKCLHAFPRVCGQGCDDRSPYSLVNMGVNMNAFDDVIAMLKANGYVQFKHPIENEHRLFESHFQKHVKSDSVCETNDRLSVNVALTSFTVPNTSNVINSVNVEITAEKKSKWWNINCYSMTTVECMEQFDEVESTLIKMFNTIA